MGTAGPMRLVLAALAALLAMSAEGRRAGYAQVEAAASNATTANSTNSTPVEYPYPINQTGDYPYPISLLFPKNTTASNVTDEEEGEEAPPTDKVTVAKKKVRAQIQRQAKFACQNASSHQQWAACMQSKVAEMTITSGNAWKGKQGEHLAVIRTNNAAGVDDQGELGHSQAPASSTIRGKYAQMVRYRGEQVIKADNDFMARFGEQDRASMAKQIAQLPADKKKHPAGPTAFKVVKAAPAKAFWMDPYANKGVPSQVVKKLWNSEVDGFGDPEDIGQTLPWYAPEEKEATVSSPKKTTPCEHKDRSKASTAKQAEEMDVSEHGDTSTTLTKMKQVVEGIESRIKGAEEEKPLMHKRVDHEISTEEESVVGDAERRVMQNALDNHVAEQKNHVESTRNSLSGWRDKSMFSAMQRALKMETDANKTVAQAAAAKQEAQEQADALAKSVDATVASSKSELELALFKAAADDEAVGKQQHRAQDDITRLLRHVKATAKRMNGTAITNETDALSLSNLTATI